MSILKARATVAPAHTSLTRHASAQVTVGTRIDTDDGEFIYITASEALGAVAVSGEPVSVTTGFAAAKIGDLDTGAFIGIAEAPFASGESGYIRSKGPAIAIVESGAVAGSLLQLSATAGKLKAITTSGTACAIALVASDNSSAAHIAIYVLGN